MRNLILGMMMSALLFPAASQADEFKRYLTVWIYSEGNKTYFNAKPRDGMKGPLEREMEQTCEGKADCSFLVTDLCFSVFSGIHKDSHKVKYSSAWRPTYGHARRNARESCFARDELYGCREKISTCPVPDRAKKVEVDEYFEPDLDLGELFQYYIENKDK